MAGKTTKKKTGGEESPLEPQAVVSVARFEAPELLSTVVQEYGLELSDAKVDAHLRTFAPFAKDLVDMESELQALLTGEITPELSKKAKELRLRYRDVRTGSNKTKADEKRDFIIEGTFLDKMDNTISNAAKSRESQCEGIEKHVENLENEAREKLKVERREKLDALNYDSDFVPLDTMTEESFARLLTKAQEAFDNAQLAEEAREAKRKEEAAEAERKRLHTARLNERIKSLNLLCYEYDDSIRAMIGQYGLIDIDIVEFDDTGIYQKTYDYIVNKFNEDKAEKEEALKKEREASERQRNRINVITALGMVYDTVSECYKGYNQVFALTEIKELSAEDFKERYDFIKKKVIDAKAEEKKANDARDEKLRLAEEQNKKLREEQEERERKEKELKDAKEAEERAAALAPDKDKINALYKTLQATMKDIPTLDDEGFNIIGKVVKEGLSTLLKYIREEAAKLK